MIKMTTDYSNFKIGIMEINLMIPKVSYEAMEAALKVYLNDCLNEVPKPPFHTGGLRGSHSIFVNGDLIATSATEGNGFGTPMIDFPIGHGDDEVVGALICHRDYAASQHEGIHHVGVPYKPHTPQTGKKWIESKMISNRTKYESIFARFFMGVSP